MKVKPICYCMAMVTMLLTIVMVCIPQITFAQAKDSTYKRFYVGSTLMMLGNFIPNDPNPPDFIEIKTWKYAWPLGVPYGKSFQIPEEKYPGYVRAFGIALVHQHFWWKGAYTSVHAMNSLQRYMAEDNKHIQNGYQLFMTYRVGYHFQLFKNRLFIEPSIAMTHWPVNTNVPDGFAKLESKWSNYFLFEPGLHFGVKF
jgi:hypothetical protein